MEKLWNLFDCTLDKPFKKVKIVLPVNIPYARHSGNYKTGLRIALAHLELEMVSFEVCECFVSKIDFMPQMWLYRVYQVFSKTNAIVFPRIIFESNLCQPL